MIGRSEEFNDRSIDYQVRDLALILDPAIPLSDGKILFHYYY